MKKSLAAAGLIGACAVCCAPLLLPVLTGASVIGFGTLGAGLLASIPLDAIFCGALLLAALAGLAVWTHQRRKNAQAECKSACSTTTCGPNSAKGSTAQR